MILETALIVVQSIPNKIWDQLCEDENEAMSMVFEAAMKQVPKDPIYGDFGENDEGDEIIPYMAVCPTCGEEFEFGEWNEVDTPYCRNCGQKIDWDGK